MNMKHKPITHNREGLVMKDLRKSILSLAVFTAVTLSPGQVRADDTEIYFSNPESSGDATLVMMLDTSGSMGTNECVEWNDSGQCTRRAKRMDELKTALFRVVDGLGSNVKMGVGRYNQNDGGRLIYPVRGLDEVDFDGVSEFFLRGDPADGDDAPGEKTDHTSRYENLPVGYDKNGVVGFVFQDMQIPRYAAVSKAYLQVTASQNSDDDVDFEYWFEDVENSKTFDLEEMIGRPMPMDNSTVPATAITWKGKIDEDWGRNRRYKIDVTDGVKAGLARAKWCGGNDFGLFMTGAMNANDSDREIYMRDALREGATAEYYGARLIIEWDAKVNPTVVGAPGAGYEEQLACRSGMFFPLGTKLDDAYDTGVNYYAEETDNIVGPSTVTGLRFTRIPFSLKGGKPDVLGQALLHLQGDNNNQDFVLTVRGVPGDSPEFEQKPGYLKGLAQTAAVATFNIKKGTFSGRFELDVTGVVREVMSAPGWDENGSVVLLVTASRNNDIDAFDAGAAIAPTLELKMSSPDMSKFVPRARDKIKEAVGGLNAYGNTPSMESYAEMARYMLGENYRWARADVYTDVGMIGTGPQYLSPLTTGSCGSNNIVLLTDGAPTNDADYDAVTDLTGFNSCRGGLNGRGGSYNCQVQLAEWLYDGTQNGVNVPIATHTIAFTNDAEINADMARVANAGNGLHRMGRNADELQAAFEEIINSVTVSNAAMAAPGVAVNQLNRFAFLDTLYYGLFKPSTQSRWEGNIKRYRADTEVLTDPVTGAPYEDTDVVDFEGRDAVNPGSGFFEDFANSWWGFVDDGSGTMVDTIDGAEVNLGGARQEMNKQARKLYVSTSEPAPGSSGQAFTEWTTASQLSATQLGLPATASSSDVATLYNWLKVAWGDPLHAPPVLITYDGPDVINTQTANDADAMDNTVFVSTNDGMVHAINGKDGSELFAWIPPGELAKTAQRFSNPTVVAPDYSRTTYGLDGGFGVWRKTKPGSEAVAEKVYLYVAQRRGGDKIYALDVSDRSSPKLKWVIDGGTGDYANLGQTWSTPVFSNIMLNKGSSSQKKVPVIVFGGGYSPADHDTAGSVSGGDAIGNSLFIVNAETGEKILEISDAGADYNHSDMKWAIPSPPAIVDFDLDGGIDMIYLSDLGGQVIRIDFDTSASSESSAILRAQTIAKLGVSSAGGISNHRRFFASPAVGIYTQPDGTETFVVGLGSGYRAHPLNEDTQDSIFLLKDHDGHAVYKGGSPSGALITRSGLADLTSGPGTSSSMGWYLDLESGEKVVSGAVFIGGILVVASYTPKVNPLDSCTNVIGNSRLYFLGVEEADGMANDVRTEGGVNSADGRYVEAGLAGLPPNPQIFVGNDYYKVLLGTRFYETNTGAGGFEKTRWFQVFSETELMNTLQDSQMP